MYSYHHQHGTQCQQMGARDTTMTIRDRAQMQMRLGSLVIIFLLVTFILNMATTTMTKIMNDEQF